MFRALRLDLLSPVSGGFFLILTCAVTGLTPLPAHAVLNDTGVTQCHNGTAIVACTETIDSDGGNNHPRQDARFGRDAAPASVVNKTGGGSAGFDFSKISNAGNVLPASAAQGATPTDWGCTFDNVTGLMWEVKTTTNTAYTYAHGSTAPGGMPPPACGGLTSCNSDAYIAAVNAAGLCGKTDWRLPTRRELLSIVDNSRGNPAIDPAYFPNTQSGFYWSADGTGDPADAWFVFFGNGGTNANVRNNGFHVRLVRAGQ